LLVEGRGKTGDITSREEKEGSTGGVTDSSLLVFSSSFVGYSTTDISVVAVISSGVDAVGVGVNVLVNVVAGAGGNGVIGDVVSDAGAGVGAGVMDGDVGADEEGEGVAVEDGVDASDAVAISIGTSASRSASGAGSEVDLSGTVLGAGRSSSDASDDDDISEVDSGTAAGLFLDVILASYSFISTFTEGLFALEDKESFLELLEDFEVFAMTSANPGVFDRIPTTEATLLSVTCTRVSVERSTFATWLRNLIFLSSFEAASSVSR
jgi:hypothetical protein